MELKRIIARDARSANEKAISLYGPDVLVISTSKVRGQTELIVAVDIEPMNTEQAVAEAFVPTDVVYQNPVQTPVSFSEVLGETMEQAKRQENKKAKAPIAAAQVDELAPQTPRQPQTADAEVGATDDREVLRGREIVDMVREELATLRKEFKLSQQMAMWQGVPIARPLVPLKNALQEAAIPAALRALLIDSIQNFEEVEPACEEIRRQLTHSLQDCTVALPTEGVQVLAGNSGAGKTLMVARLAQHASATLGSEQVLVISYNDMRAGAWNQTQLLSAQSGVDCFRANNAGTLKLLLEEHAHRKLIIIDTPGVQMTERLGEVVSICPQAQCHAVVSADASQATLRRLLATPCVQWHSLMVSKLDESTQPWALIQCLTESHIRVSAASRGERMSDWVQQLQAQDLVNVGLAHLSMTPVEGAHEEIRGTLAMASARIAKMASQHTGATHE